MTKMLLLFIHWLVDKPEVLLMPEQQDTNKAEFIVSLILGLKQRCWLFQIYLGRFCGLLRPTRS